MFSSATPLISLAPSYRLANRLAPWLITATVVLFAIGLYWGLWVAPTDYKQGEAYRIIYIHVPAAWMSLLTYVVMTAAGVVALVWRVKLAEIIHTECAPLGAAFTAITLATGMLWGKPMWGAYWVWDARLTSELILLFLYLGVIGLGSVIADPRKSARATALLSVIGLVNIPVIHYSVIWWNTLHQGPTVTRFDAPAAHPSILWPLLFMALVMKLYFVAALCVRVRLAIARRCRDQQWFGEALAASRKPEIGAIQQ